TVYEGRWAIFTFHGINEGHLPVSSEDLSGFLRFLHTHRDEIWVAPVVEVAEHIAGERKRLGLVF
ncbi:MAG: hypothetical protein FGF53_10825, partial [Candidatus Brockarchaeota archaeon]|nr:hypothetical protein [Candidatus Brockarchaeota archaeon]